MGKIAFVFSGQGSQYSGMGQDLFQSSWPAAEVFRMADSIRPGTSKQCFVGSKEELMQTQNTQPCIFCVGLAAAEALLEKGIMPHCAAGFSAGEVTALAFGGYLKKEDAFKYVVQRAVHMQRSGRKNPGLMFAVLGLEGKEVENICSQVEGRYPVNFNTMTQVSVACTGESAGIFPKAVAAAGGRAIKLPVSGGFHSPMMGNARASLEKEFKELEFTLGEILVYANVSAKPYQDRQEMFSQINSPVLWYQTILNMDCEGVDTFIELGPGKTLTNMIAKILPKATVLNVEDSRSLDRTVEVVRNAKG